MQDPAERARLANAGGRAMLSHHAWDEIDAAARRYNRPRLPSIRDLSTALDVLRSTRRRLLNIRTP